MCYVFFGRKVSNNFLIWLRNQIFFAHGNQCIVLSDNDNLAQKGQA